MALGKNKKQKPQKNAVAVPQTGRRTHPFPALSSYSPLAGTDAALYKALREAIPIIDAAIYKIVRLIGTFN